MIAHPFHWHDLAKAIEITILSIAGIWAIVFGLIWLRVRCGDGPDPHAEPMGDWPHYEHKD